VAQAQGFFAVCLVLVLVVGSLVWTFHRSGSLIDAWAASEGYDLVRREYCALWRGPFFWTTSRNQTVYRVTVRLRGGSLRSGWVRCGSWWGGLLSDQVEVRWDT